MSSIDLGWGWFDPRRDPANDAALQGSADPLLSKSTARCFSGPDGRRVLQHLRAITLERSLGPAATDAMLRHLEGQRSLVVYLLMLTARGSGVGGEAAPATVASEP